MNAQDIHNAMTDNLRRLRFLAEAKAQAFDSERISQGKASSRRPMGGKSTEDECLERYEDVNRAVAKLIDKEQRRIDSLLMSTAEQQWRIGQPENRGKRPRVVAEALGLEESTVRRIRAAKHLNTETGEPGPPRGRHPNSLANLRPNKAA